MLKGKDTANFQEMLSGKKVPLVVLDTKWYQLFDDGKVPNHIKSMQVELNDLLKTQGRLNSELKDLKSLKSGLIKDIVDNMEATNADAKASKQEKKLEDSKRLIQEINDKIEKNEDEQYEIPKKISDLNKQIVIATMEICYSNLQSNKEEINRINAWIEDTRIQLKKNIIIKQDKEIQNTSIYSYMHDILGPEIVDLFDQKYEDTEKL